jgi:hypothetical protein
VMLWTRRESAHKEDVKAIRSVAALGEQPQ